jgi:hypothetical protein
VRGESEGPDFEHLGWAIDQRAEIQRTLLALYEFVCRHRPPQNDQQKYVLGFLIGVWRAVFLADTFRDDVSVHGSQEQFLKKVITDNAIGFSDDRQNRHWTIGYYLENAKIRLSQVATFIESHASVFGLKKNSEVLAKVMPFLRLTGTMGVELTRYEWESAHYALRLLFGIIEPDAPLEAKPPQVPRPKGLQ